MSQITVTDENTKVFSSAGAGKVYTKTTTTTKGDDGTDVETVVSTAVKQGDSYDSETKYYEPTITYGEALTWNTQWNDYYTVGASFALTLGANQTIHAIYWENGNAIITKTQPDWVTYDNPSKPYNWDQTSGEYYYYCIFTGTASEEQSYTIAMSDFKNGVYTNGDFTITLLTSANRDSYGKATNTITSKVDNLYSKDAGSDEYIYRAKGTTWEYTTIPSLYLGTVTVGEDPIADNETYFFTTHKNYLTGAVLSFAEYLPHAVGSSYNTVIIKTYADVETKDDNSKKANINNEITRALVKIGAITTLNLQDTYLPAYVAHEGGNDTEDASFFPGTPGQWTGYEANTSITTLYTPCVADNSTLTKGVLNYMNGLTYLYLGEGIETLDTDALSYTGYAQHYMLKTVTFPNSLRYAKKTCMNGQTDVVTLTFPAKMASIEEGAFQGTNPKDVYFLGVEAPQVAANAWGENNYISNNAMENKVYDGQEGYTVYVDKATGYTCRTNYNTRNGWMTMLHYPTACSKEQAAKYTDLTRTYKKVVYGTTGDPDIKTTYFDDGAIQDYYYQPALEENDLYGNGDITKNTAAVKKFFNIYPAGTYDGNYNGGFDDMYLREQYQWPSIDMAKRSYIVACNDVLWNGKTTIGEGIRNAATSEGTSSTYTGNGKEFIGLHQFVFAQGDVTTDNTNEWDVTKYADGKWHSLCLPFDITKAKLEETFGPDKEGNYNYRVCKFNQVDRNEKNLKLYFNNEQYQGKNLNADDVVIEGHVSYMVKLKKENIAEGEKVLLKNYVMKEGSAVPTNVKVNEATESDDTKTANQYYFIGQYLSGVTIPQYSYFFSKSTAGFRFQGGTTGKWNAYSSVVEAPNGAEDNARYFSDGNSDSKLSTIWDEDETTGIDRVTIEAGGEIVYTNANVYNLNGQLVSTNGLQGLSKGIYVTNGKKVLVK